MKTRFTGKLLLPGICAVLFILVSCEKEDTPVSVTYEGTYTTTNELLNPAPMLKQRTTGTSPARPLDIARFVATATITITPPPPSP